MINDRRNIFQILKMDLENTGDQPNFGTPITSQGSGFGGQSFSLFGGGISQPNPTFSLFPQNNLNFSSNSFTQMSQPPLSGSLFSTGLQQRSLFDGGAPTLNQTSFGVGTQGSFGFQEPQRGSMQAFPSFQTSTTNTFGLNLNPIIATGDDDPNDEDYKPPAGGENSDDEEEYMAPDEMQEGNLLSLIDEVYSNYYNCFLEEDLTEDPNFNVQDYLRFRSTLPDGR